LTAPVNKPCSVGLMDLERIGLRTECTHSERILNASE
jgi:hypothetical protein